MSIETEFESTITNVKNAYQGLDNLGATIPQNKTIENIKNCLDEIYNNLPKTSYAEGSNITLSNTLKGKLDFEKIYQEVEYIEGTGTQYITTNYYQTSDDMQLKTKIYIPEMLSIEKDIIGNQDGQTGRFVLGMYQKKIFGYSKVGANNTDLNVFSNEYSGSQTLDISIDYNSVNKTKTLVVNSLSTTGNYNANISNTNKGVQIFANGDNANSFTGRVYYVQILENDILKLDLIPCYRKLDNVIGMYDKVSGKFYTNAGTGTFTKGADVGSGFGDIVGYGQTEQKSYEGYQLLNYTLETLKALNTSGTWNNNVYTLNGLTFTVNEDLTITVNGTSTANTDFNIQNFFYTNGNEYTLIDELEDNIYGKYTVMIASYSKWGQNTLITDKYITFTASTTSNISTRIVVYNNNTLSNKIFKPMLYSGAYDSSKTFEKYTGNSPSPSPSYPQEIEVVRGKNRLNLENCTKLGNATRTNETSNSVELTGVGAWSNGTYIFPNFAINTDLRISLKLKSSVARTTGITIYGTNTNDTSSLTSISEDTSSLTSNTEKEYSVIFNSGNYKYICMRIWTNYSTTTLDRAILEATEIMLLEGSTATSYLPYNTLEIEERGKNYAKLDQSINNRNTDITYTENVANSIVGSKTSNNGQFLATFVAQVVSGQSYIISGTATNCNLYAYKETLGGEPFANISSSTLPKSFTSDYTGTIVLGMFFPSAITGTASIKNFQLEEGSSATTYEPYQTPQTYQLSLGDKELYTDSEIVRVSKNNFKFVDKWKKIFIDSNDIEGISKDCAIISHKYFIDIADVGIYQQDIVPPILSNIDKSEKWSYINNNDDLSGKMFLLKLTESQNQFRLYLNATTVQEAKTNLDNSNAYFIYKTNTPIETPITNTTLINQLEEWYNSQSFTGTTIIEIDGQLPLIIKVRALKGE